MKTCLNSSFSFNLCHFKLGIFGYEYISLLLFSFYIYWYLNISLFLSVCLSIHLSFHESLSPYCVMLHISIIKIDLCTISFPFFPCVFFKEVKYLFRGLYPNKSVLRVEQTVLLLVTVALRYDMNVGITCYSFWHWVSYAITITSTAEDLIK